MRLNIKKRMEFIETRLFWEGAISRRDLTEHFGISNPQASKDIKQYIKLAPDNIHYDNSAKKYLAPEKFYPRLTTPSCESYFSDLLVSKTPNNSFICGKIPPYDIIPIPTRITDPNVLRAILKAIKNSAKIGIEYQSMSRPNPIFRYIAPHTLVNDGFRWHIRAYCRKKEDYRDFNLSRIIRCEEMKETVIDHSNDLLWHSYIRLKLIPHPKLNRNQQKCIEHEYGMVDGECELNTRAAFVFYLEKNLKLSQNSEGKSPNRYQIVLANREEVDSTIEILKRLQANKLKLADL